MSDKEAQVDWDDDGFTDACYERVRQLRAELAQARAELAAVDKGLSEFYSFYDDHGVCVMRQELERLRAELVQRDRKHKNNAKIIQIKSQEISRVRTKLAQARDELAHAKIQANKFSAALTDACATRDALARKCTQLEEDREYNARLVEERDRTIAHVRRELKDLEGANRAYEQQVRNLVNNRDFWVETCRAAERERDQIRKEAQEQSDLVQRDWLSPEDTKGAQQRIDELEAKRDHWLRKHCESEREAEGLRRQAR